uniref:Ig-like domain-containing protein n=1 Tax=Paramormyrops kingsleyae TaxID=1676925 RepID=A0A3B3R130_9TELE
MPPIWKLNVQLHYNPELHVKINEKHCRLIDSYLATSFILCNHILGKLFKIVSRKTIFQPVPDTVQPGDSVTLQCTIETGSCAGEHSVYWFRHGSGESLPGVIYSHGNRSDECEKSPEAGSPTRSCVYSLPKRNLSPSDAGTYYCAVAMCGEMLFGNGTKVHVEGKLLIKSIISSKVDVWSTSKIYVSKQINV